MYKTSKLRKWFDYEVERKKRSYIMRRVWCKTLYIVNICHTINKIERNKREKENDKERKRERETEWQRERERMS